MTAKPPKATTMEMTIADFDEGSRAVFEDLSMQALKEETAEGFIDRLTERTFVLNNLLTSGMRCDIQVAELWLQREGQILQRLETERHATLRQMEEVSRSSKALRGYAPRYPLPIYPVFFDTTG
jgi:hypothetical protein